MIGRREFMTMLGTLGLGAFAGRAAAGEQALDHYPGLVAVLNAQNRVQGGRPMESRELENLRYACRAIKPSNHVELAFVAAVGPKWQPNDDLVDEFVRRRAGFPPELDDHPLLALDGWGMPDTFRIPVYREQLVTLIRELTKMTQRDSIALLSRYLQGRVDIPPLSGMAGGRYKQDLTAADFERLERIIRGYGYRTMPYAWCSTIASRAEALVARGS